MKSLCDRYVEVTNLRNRVSKVEELDPYKLQERLKLKDEEIVRLSVSVENLTVELSKQTARIGGSTSAVTKQLRKEIDRLTRLLTASKSDREWALEEELRRVKEAFAPVAILPKVFTKSQRAIIEALLAREDVSYKQLHVLLYSNRTDPPSEDGIFSAFVHQLRSKLKSKGIKIETIVGYGFKLTSANKDKLRAWIVEASGE